MAPPRRVRTTDSCHGLPIAPNLIARNFTAAAPPELPPAYISAALAAGLANKPQLDIGEP
jgi:hypothetical protein